jgi:hypothetical protein
MAQLQNCRIADWTLKVGTSLAESAVLAICGFAVLQVAGRKRRHETRQAAEAKRKACRLDYAQTNLLGRAVLEGKTEENRIGEGDRPVPPG